MDKVKEFVGTSADVGVNNFIETSDIQIWNVVGYQKYFSTDGTPDETSILIKYTEDE